MCFSFDTHFTTAILYIIGPTDKPPAPNNINIVQSYQQLQVSVRFIHIVILYLLLSCKLETNWINS